MLELFRMVVLGACAWGVCLCVCVLVADANDD